MNDRDYTYETVLFSDGTHQIHNVPHFIKNNRKIRSLRVEIRLHGLLDLMQTCGIAEYDFQEYDRGLFGT